MPRPSFEDAEALIDPYMISNWNIIFPRGIPGAPSADIRQVAVKAQTTSVPGMNIDQVTAAFRGVELNYAGRQVYNKTLEVTFIELRDISTRDTFRSWMEYARNNNTNQGSYKSMYSTSALWELYDDIPNLVRIIEIRGMFPISVGDMQIDGSQSQTGQLQVTFSYDRHLDYRGA